MLAGIVVHLQVAGLRVRIPLTQKIGGLLAGGGRKSGQVLVAGGGQRHHVAYT